MGNKLPEQFAYLAQFVPEWALTNEHDRFQKLHSTTIAQLRPFYDAMLVRMPEILPYLNQYKLDALPDDAMTLFHLAMTFSETAHPIDLKWTDVDFTDAYPWQKFEFRSVSLPAASDPHHSKD